MIDDERAADAGLSSAAMGEPVVDLLERTWADLIALGEGLTEQEWLAPTACPGWSVQDNVSHVIGVERMLAGDAPPDIDVSGAAHVRNDLGAVNERWVAARRDRPGPDVLAELREVTDARLAELRALPDERWDEIGWSPIGQVPYRAFMQIRVLDSWTHTMDIRDALGRGGGWDGEVGRLVLERLSMSLPMVVGKRAAAPDGATVVVELTGPLAAEIVVGVDGRAALLDGAPPDPTVRLSMGADTFRRLTHGRQDGADALAGGDVTIDGDDDLGRRVVTSMSAMI